jgi:hypothetical protein
MYTRVTVKRIGPTEGDLSKKLLRHVNSIQRGLIVLGDKIQNYLWTTIAQNTKRTGSTGKLASSITTAFVRTQDKMFVGVGHMPTMFDIAPYWYVVNYGAHFPGTYEAAAMGIKGSPFIPPPNYGHFDGQGPIAGYPIGGQLGPRWTHTGDKADYLMVPRKFRPMNYIEKTNSWLSLYWQPYWSILNIR